MMRVNYGASGSRQANPRIALWFAGSFALSLLPLTLQAQDRSRPPAPPPASQSPPSSVKSNNDGRSGSIQYGSPLFGGQATTRNGRGDIRYGTQYLPKSNLERFKRSREGVVYYFNPNNDTGRPPFNFRNGAVPGWWLGQFGGGYYPIPAGAFYFGDWGNLYFPNAWGYYPFWYPGYVNGVTVLSPYAYYQGLIPPYIGQTNIYVTPPPAVQTPVPYYNEAGRYQGSDQDADEYYLNKKNAESRAATRDRALTNAISNIRRAWQGRDIDLLTRHIAPDSKIAVMLRGKYQYSLDAGDYVDMTRDAFRTIRTDRFELGTPRMLDKNTFSITGQHVYRDKEGNPRTVIISYVLEKQGDKVFITQVGIAPDRIEDSPKPSEKPEQTSPNEDR